MGFISKNEHIIVVFNSKNSIFRMLNKKNIKMNLQENYLEEIAMNLNPGGEGDGNDDDSGTVVKEK
jgi:hypothetical protein